jgi:ankyrin repeat protein
MVELLLECGANINTKNISRLTPLRMAVRRGHIEVADFLMSKGGKK